MRALETAMLPDHGRPTCSECTDRLKKDRGCNRPGEDYGEGNMAFRYSSPMLEGEILRECPVGLVLRESPHTYDVIDLLRGAEQTSVTAASKLPRYMQHALRLYNAEVGRLRDIQAERSKHGNDSAYAARVLRGA